MFSLGVMVCELFTYFVHLEGCDVDAIPVPGRPPARADIIDQALARLACAADLQVLVKSMVKTKPVKRPTAMQALSALRSVHV